MINLASILSVISSLLLLAACGGSSGGSGSQQATAEAPPPPPPPLAESYALSSDDLVPANISFDPVDRAFYAASRNGGSILRIDADGSESVFREVDARLSSIGGIGVDPQARRLWACAVNVDNIDDRVWVYDLETGELVMEFLLAALYTNGSCHDLVLDDSGVAYIVDGANPTIYRLDPENGEGELYLVDPLLNGIGPHFGPNGIEIIDDGSALIIGTFASGQLTYISLPEPEQVFAIELQGDVLTSPNGMAMFRGDLYATSLNAVMRVRFDDDFSQGTVVSRPQEGGLSSAVVAEDALYVVKSETYSFNAGLPLDLPFRIFKLDVAAYD